MFENKKKISRREWLKASGEIIGAISFFLLIPKVSKWNRFINNYRQLEETPIKVLKIFKSQAEFNFVGFFKHEDSTFIKAYIIDKKHSNVIHFRETFQKNFLSKMINDYFFKKADFDKGRPYVSFQDLFGKETFFIKNVSTSLNTINYSKITIDDKESWIYQGKTIQIGNKKCLVENIQENGIFFLDLGNNRSFEVLI